MQILKYLMQFILALVALYLLFVLFGGGWLNAQTNKPSPIIDVLGYELKIGPPIASGDYFYTIKINGSIHYKGNESADVIPVVKFKGISTKAYVTEKEKKSDFFSVSENAKDSIKLDAKITSNEPPIKDSNMPNTINEKDSYVFTTSKNSGKFIVKLESVETEKIVKDIEKPFGKCEATFTIECRDDFREINLKSCKDNEEECDKYVVICDGSVHIKTDELNCDEKTATLSVQAYDGRYFDVKESAYLSFWKKTECTERFNALEELLEFCTDDFLSGETLETDLIE